jgi:hypothetical protein
MATEILLPPRNEATADSYRLSDQDRLAIRSQTPAARLAKRIEKERQAFIQKNGNPYGLIVSGQR